MFHILGALTKLQNPYLWVCDLALEAGFEFYRLAMRRIDIGAPPFFSTGVERIMCHAAKGRAEFFNSSKDGIVIGVMVVGLARSFCVAQFAPKGLRPECGGDNAPFYQHRGKAKNLRLPGFIENRFCFITYKR